ncbi:MAG TPA: gamma-glutamyltransferase family protein [Ramlibacter sp.]|jgi:gamma-glutamyltranspeptidase/glutathione hydrolase|uniref:gamma-glutamyltransferase family protein n=1 Tax=Ramlibacter sp. TaxID=1917967 RepID=UPI002D27D3ED|nr:gamma-glutamyltransferase family protein [Ramlibacter sp.]HZY19440.1 gamma-glutamyltransferase family protein [Ramlibacter sp.]
MNTAVRALALAAALAGCAAAPGDSAGEPRPLQPEAAAGRTDQPGWAGRRFAVAAANPLAAEAGHRILVSGGSAIDAAVAVQMVLTLVEPQSSGIGGGAFLLHFDGQEVEAFDGRETAPAAADDKLFLGTDGRPLAFHEAVVGGRSVGVPGAVRMLEMAHRQHGKLPWATLFQPAIMLAERGFQVSPRLNALLTSDAHLRKDPAAAAYFFQADGQPHAVGTVLRNPELAAVLRRIAAEGSAALHEGEIAQAIVDKVHAHRSNPGKLSLADLAGYRAKKRDPICHDERVDGRVFRICGFPPPGSGAIAIGQILGILARTDAASLPLAKGVPGADWLHLYTEAARLALADRAQYIGDPDFVQPPGGRWSSLLDPAYLAQRARLIGPRSMKVAQPGMPAGARAVLAPMPAQPESGTSHISIVDAQGRTVAMTTTIEDQFGSRQMVKGFLLNNQLTDFSFTPADAQGRPVANRVQPGKRPRSSMAPTLVFDKASGQLVMSVGSPGGALIIHYTAKALYAVLHWGMTPQQAIDLPNFAAVNGPTVLEENRFPPATVDALRARGAEVREQAMTSGLQAITRGQAHGEMFWFGGADPRREGVVRGD